MAGSTAAPAGYRDTPFATSDSSRCEDAGTCSLRHSQLWGYAWPALSPVGPQPWGHCRSPARPAARHRRCAGRRRAALRRGPSRPGDLVTAVSCHTSRSLRGRPHATRVSTARRDSQPPAAAAAAQSIIGDRK